MCVHVYVFQHSSSDVDVPSRIPGASQSLMDYSIQKWKAEIRLHVLYQVNDINIYLLYNIGRQRGVESLTALRVHIPSPKQ